MTLDDGIQQDLSELYNGENTPGEIQGTVELDGLIAANPGQTSFAMKALPGYYTGKRDAKTVMVILLLVGLIENYNKLKENGKNNIAICRLSWK